MANIGCSIDSIIERIETIKSILRKYSIISAGAASWGPIKGFSASIDIPLAEWFSKMAASGAFKSLYDNISKVYGYIKQGIAAVKQAQQAYQQLLKDFGTVVENLSGILQDLKDMTILDIQVLELDLAKLGLNPGEILTRIKNGEDPDLVLEGYAEKLSETSKALLDKLSKPLTVSLDFTCQKLPNIAIIEVGNVRKVYTMPAKPQPPKAGPGEHKDQVPAPISTGYISADYETLKAAIGQPDDTWNWSKLSSGVEVAEFRHTLNDKSFNIVKTAVKESGKTALANEMTIEMVKLNLDAIGKYIIKDFKKAFPEVTITSGFRDYPYVGKSKNISQHAVGCAVDFQFPESSAHKFNQKENPKKVLNDILNRINIKITSKDKTSGGSKTMSIGKFRLIHEFVKGHDSSSGVKPNRFHLDANFVFSSLGNGFGISPTIKLEISNSGTPTGKKATPDSEPY